jgi:hypothetical protein
MKKTVISIVCVVALAAVVTIALGAWMNAPGRLPPQPIAFNHALHLERVQGLECQDCHQFVMTEPYAGLPSKYVCFGCHDPAAEAEGEAPNPQMAALMAFAHTDGDIPWHRVTALPPDVFFSHRRHAAVAKLDCLACHPEVPNWTSPPERGPIRMRMETCLACHRNAGTSVDCMSCHR